MCRSIHTLFNYDPPATRDEIRNAALQFVRKISGFREPSQVNRVAFERAVENIATASRALLGALETSAEPRDRETETKRARARAANRYGR